MNFLGTYKAYIPRWKTRKFRTEQNRFSNQFRTPFPVWLSRLRKNGLGLGSRKCLIVFEFSFNTNDKKRTHTHTHTKPSHSLMSIIYSEWSENMCTGFATMRVLLSVHTFRGWWKLLKSLMRPYRSSVTWNSKPTVVYNNKKKKINAFEKPSKINSERGMDLKFTVRTCCSRWNPRRFQFQTNPDLIRDINTIPVHVPEILRDDNRKIVKT